MSNQIQLRERASYFYCARSWRQQTNPSRKKIFHRVENVLKQLVHTSAVRSSRYEALGKFGEHERCVRVARGVAVRSSAVRSSRYEARGKFGEHERCVRVARGVAESNSSFLSALQTSRVLHISMNARWRMNQLLFFTSMPLLDSYATIGIKKTCFTSRVRERQADKNINWTTVVSRDEKISHALRWIGILCSDSKKKRKSFLWLFPRTLAFCVLFK